MSIDDTETHGDGAQAMEASASIAPAAEMKHMERSEQAFLGIGEQAAEPYRLCQADNFVTTPEIPLHNPSQADGNFMLLLCGQNLAECHIV